MHTDFHGWTDSFLVFIRVHWWFIGLMPSIFIATANAGKAREFQEMLGGAWEVRTLGDLPEVPEIVEDGATFEANALIKVRALADWRAGPVLADDSGLEVDALGGAPGVHSARYAGRHGDDAGNNHKLLAALAGVPPERRGAQFRCVLVVRMPDGMEQSFQGLCRGRILEAPRGGGGFGYDPLFVPEGESRTLAELAPAAKHALSHRGQALRQAGTWLAARI
jgi:XTP/dITP diphosphohydrolase